VIVRDFVASIDAGLFWGLTVGFVVGVLSAWRFARVYERFREAVWQTKNHFKKGLEFYRFANEHLALLMGAGVVVALVTAGVVVLVFLRVTAQA
jgi:hypothetical protein